MADRLFGQLAPDRAARNVSRALSLARTVVPAGWLHADAATLWLDPPRPLRLDLDDAIRLLEAAVDAPPGPADWTRIRSALLLSDQLVIEDMYEEWAQEPRRTLAALARQAAVALARASQLEVDWSRVVTHDPGSVEAWEALLTAAAARGRAELAATYAECRVLHDRELGGAPDPALRELVERHRRRAAPRATTEIVGRHTELQRLMDRVVPGGRG